MNCKEYVNRKYKEHQDNLPQIVKGYSNKQLKVQIDMNRERINNSIYCKVCTPKKVKRLLTLLLEETKYRNLIL